MVIFNKKLFYKISRIYTKTFGEKIWTILHRVLPSNFRQKNKKGFRFLLQKDTKIISSKKIEEES